jgi:anti-sigma factor RsiW
MDCEKASGLMMKYMDMILTDAEALSLNKHIKTCEQCKEDFMMYDSIMNGFSEMSLVEAPEGFEDSVMEAVAQLPVHKAKTTGVSGLLGVFSVLIGIGFILILNSEAIIGWMQGYPQLEPLLSVIIPAATAIDNISYQVSTSISEFTLSIQQVAPNLIFVPLLLFGVLAGAQFMMYRKERVVVKK